MTFAIFFILFLGLFIVVLNILPVAGALSPAIASSISLIIGYMKAWNFLLPIDTLFICVGTVLTFHIAVWGWQALKWVVSVLRGNQSGS